VDRETVLNAFFLVAGSLIITLGAGLVAIYAFRESTLVVYAGFLLFIFGYKFTWYGYHRVEEMQEVHENIRYMLREVLFPLLKKYGSVAGGGLGMAYGTVLFARTIVKFDPAMAVLAGLFCFGGYMLAHNEVNKVVV
jgi:hypothetical protein